MSSRRDAAGFATIVEPCLPAVAGLTHRARRLILSVLTLHKSHCGLGFN